ncbi:hypothetical protein [Nocardia xishanensis]|uniref:hypothetical protein n=1 Tax=Nocardia xishanensis TaxID=238964 RepID=UPI000AA4E155|nr:hypothetical protein [Nocardia xishanensis]
MARKLWHQRWDDSFQRLADLRTKVNEITWDAALARATDRDRMISHLLKRRTRSVTTALAAEPDPFILPMPGPDTLVVQNRWISQNNFKPNSRYRDDIWSLGPLTDNPP